MCFGTGVSVLASGAARANGATIVVGVGGDAIFLAGRSSGAGTGAFVLPRNVLPLRVVDGWKDVPLRVAMVLEFGGGALGKKSLVANMQSTEHLRGV